MAESRLTKPDSDYCHDICGGVNRCTRLKENSKRCRGYYLYEKLKIYENTWPLLSGSNEKEPTVYEHLILLPQSLFEASLLSLMGFPLDSEKKEWFHEWMNRPYSDVFPTNTFSDPQSDIATSPDHTPTLLGKMISTLPVEKQEQLKDAMKNYCEVCDYISDE